MAGLEDAARTGRPKAGLVLSETERVQLMRWARRPKTAQFLAMPAKIVLRCAEGGTNKQAEAPRLIWVRMSRPWSAGGCGSSPGAWRGGTTSRGRAAQPVLPMIPGILEGRTYDTCGTASPACSPPTAPSSARCIAGTAPSSSGSS
jgi:hypothetical protein